MALYKNFLKCESLENLIEIRLVLFVKSQSENGSQEKSDSIMILVDYLNLSDQFKLSLLMVFRIKNKKLRVFNFKVY